MADTIESYQATLAENPGDWETRSLLAQALYEAEDYDNASETILATPELPGDEENVIFAATIVGAVDLDQAHTILDSFLASENSEGAHQLKAELYEAAGDEANAAIHAAAAQNGGVLEATEERVEAITAARKLAPPGEESKSVPLHTASQALAAAAPAPALEAIPHEEQHGDEFVSVDGERALIVGEGEAIHAADKAPDAKEKVTAITVAILVHVAVGLLLTLYLVARPRPNPPQISVSALANTDDSSMENQTVSKMQQRSASAVASAQPVISSTAFSNIAMPEVVDVSQDLTMVSMSDSDAGFGMSMSGFGDVSNMGAIPASMQSRCSMSQRMKRLRESGGEDRAEKAVRNGLEWLSKTQSDDGSFGVKYKCAMTGLTLLAYLGHCETPESPKFGDSVVKAALYLMERGKKNDGRLAMEEKGNHWVYEHAIATYALGELFTMTKESGKEIPRLESVLKKAVAIIVEGQTDLGGWAYGYSLKPGGDDMSVAGWQVQALKAAYNTGRDFRGVEDALDNAMAYEAKIQDAEGAFKYRPDDARGKQSLTGAALLGMQVWGEMDSAAYKKGMAYLTGKVAKNPPVGNNFYQPYYNTQAFFLHGGTEWDLYNKNFQNKLLDAQNADGSWTGPGVGGHGSEDSHTMNTAWGCLMLEVYYRYLPTTDKVKDLKAR